MKLFIKIIAQILVVLSFGVSAQTKEASPKPPKGKAMAVFAEGCFWCSEHVFEAVEGVGEVISGYSAGKLKNPTYEQVCSETTGHAEAILVYYDPNKIGFGELVKVFFASHDPTTPNQQGPDKGSSYRSIAFYQNDAEKEIILKEIEAVNQSKRFKNKVVTEVLPVQKFYIAEDYHQDYIEHHPTQSYVKNVSIPRFELFKKNYKGKLKSK
jgi:peptide-methionine (S)-S-oxide reductase